MFMGTKKRFIIHSVLFIMIFVLIISITSIAKEQISESFGIAQVIYPWGDISFEEQKTVLANNPYKIGVSVPHLKSAVWISMANGIFLEAEKSGCESVTFLAAKGYDDLDTQINQTENLIELGVDAIIIAPISSGGNIESCEEAIRRGIPIIFWGQNCHIRNHSGQATGNNYEMGQMQAEWTAQKLGGKGNIILLSGPPGINWTTINYEGILNGLSKYPDIKIIDQKWTDIDPAIGMELTERLMMRYPDVDAFICTDVLGHGCGQAVAAADKQNEILVVMNYPEKATLPMIEEGLVDYGVINPPLNTGRITVSLAIRALNDPTDQIIGANLFIEPIEITIDNIKNVDLSGVLAPEDWTVPSGGTMVFN